MLTPSCTESSSRGVLKQWRRKLFILAGEIRAGNVIANPAQRRTTMSRMYNVIDSDGHVLEPPGLWVEYLDPKYRDRAPQMFVDSDGKELLRIEGKVFGRRSH